MVVAGRGQGQVGGRGAWLGFRGGLTWKCSGLDPRERSLDRPNTERQRGRPSRQATRRRGGASARSYALVLGGDAARQLARLGLTYPIVAAYITAIDAILTAVLISIAGLLFW